jgi:hypothetical protein
VLRPRWRATLRALGPRLTLWPRWRPTDTVLWQAHNGAPKYFRDKVPAPLGAAQHTPSTIEWVQEVVHGKNQDYTFGPWVRLDWRCMIAASTENDHRHIIGPGITAVAVWLVRSPHARRRPRALVGPLLLGDRGLQHHAGRWCRDVGAPAVTAKSQEVGDAAAAARRGANREHS